MEGRAGNSQGPGERCRLQHNRKRPRSHSQSQGGGKEDGPRQTSKKTQASPPACPGERLPIRGAALGRDPEGPECGRRSGAGLPSSSRRRALGSSGNKPSFGSPGGRGGARGPFSLRARASSSGIGTFSNPPSLSPPPTLGCPRSQIHTSFMSRSLAGEVIPAGADL